jgi:hypothetical protein
MSVKTDSCLHINEVCDFAFKERLSMRNILHTIHMDVTELEFERGDCIHLAHDSEL